MIKERLRILFVSSDKFPPFRVDVTVLFGKEIVNKGHSIDWLLQSDKTLKHGYETKWCGGTAFVGPTDNRPTFLCRLKLHVFSILHDLKMMRILKQRKNNVIIIKDKFVSGLFAIIASKIFNIKFVYWLSFPFPEDSFFRVKEKTVKYPLLYWFRGLCFHLMLYKVILPLCDHAFVQTDYMKRNISGKGIPLDKMTSVPMAVSISDIPFYGYKQSDLCNYKLAKVVYLGTLDKIRKMGFLLRSFKIVLQDRKDAKLFLVGGSEAKEDEEELRDEAKRLGIAHAVVITGFIPQKEAWLHVKDADVCVSPIYPSPIFDVGSPTKLLEYMALGKASVANDHPEQRVVIKESNAGICVPYDENSFAKAILYLIINKDIACLMGISGRRYIEENRNYSQTSVIVESALSNVIN